MKTQIDFKSNYIDWFVIFLKILNKSTINTKWPNIQNAIFKKKKKNVWFLVNNERACEFLQTRLHRIQLLEKQKLIVDN